METDQEKLILSQLRLYHLIQPIVDIVTNEVVGYEMLLRCQQYPNPKQLFDYAKQYQQTYELDMLSIQMAFHWINEHHRQLKDTYIFVNILPTTLSHPSYFEGLQQLQSSLKLRRSQIVFEITEDDKEASVQSIQQDVKRLKQYGYLVALDDFGQGDSTIQYVQQLNPHIVKLDRYYTKDLAESFERKTLIDNMLFLLDKESEFIIEGIETEADLKAAKSLGVRYAQGFYLGKPKQFEYYFKSR